jgi:tripartite ATP-independent transporter DctP family solute receptor
MLKKSRCLVLTMVLILVVVSCNAFAANKPIKVIYGSIFTVDTYFWKSDLYFKELVEKNSKGQVLVELYSWNQLGSGPEMYQAVRSGAQHMVTSAIGELVQFWPKYATFDLPYLYRDKQHLLKVAEKFTSIINQNEMADKIGMRVVGMRIRAPRHLTTKFPVHKLDDIKGLKIRVPSQPTSVALWKVLGAAPTIIPSGVYTSLASGVVDAQENPIESTSKVFEVTKYCALTGHKSELVPIVANNNWWKGLKRAQRTIIVNALKKSNKMSNELALKAEEEAKIILKKEGVQFTEPDLRPFKEKAKTIWKEFGDEAIIKKIQAVK